MMGKQADQPAFLYDFALDKHVPAGHMLRSIDRFVELDEMRAKLAPFYSTTGRPSIDPELLIRMLLVGYCYGKLLLQYRKPFTKPRTGVVWGNRRLYRAERRDCAACPLKARCCPGPNPRKLSVSVHEAARDIVRNLRDTPEYLQSRRERKKVEMLFAHLKRILRLGRLRLRGPCGARDEFILAAIAQNLRKLAKLIPMPQIAMAI